MHSTGFPPVAGADARVLILGSLPGAMSLARREYYAQPRNAFWPIMGRLVGAAPELPYAERLLRPGSLDAAILPGSVVANDFPAFFAAHPGLALICFNGAKAADLFARLAAAPPAIGRARLPSTSPAHAGLPFADKLARWRHALAGAGVAAPEMTPVAS